DSSFWPFIRKELKPTAFLSKMVGGSLKGNALIELNNALSDASNVKKVTVAFVDGLNSRYGFDVRTEFAKELANLYAEAVRFFARGGELSADDKSALEHLRDLFGIPEEMAAILRERVTIPRFKVTVEGILGDSRVTRE